MKTLIIFLLLVTTAYANEITCIGSQLTPCVTRSGICWGVTGAEGIEECCDGCLGIVKDEAETKEEYVGYCFTIKQLGNEHKVYVMSKELEATDIIEDMFCSQDK